MFAYSLVPLISNVQISNAATAKVTSLSIFCLFSVAMLVAMALRHGGSDVDTLPTTTALTKVAVRTFHHQTQHNPAMTLGVQGVILTG